MKNTLALLTLLVACGDSGTVPAPDGGDDIDADTTRGPRAVVVAGDFSAIGVMSELDVDARTSANNIAPDTAVGVDPILRKHGDELFVINRIENNVTILSAGDFTFVDQLGTGAGSNPQDVAIEGDKLWIPVYGGSGVIEVTRDTKAITEIDLSADDPDGKPNCASIYKVDDKLFVTCQLLDDTMQFLPPRGNGKVYVVDAATRAIEHELDLSSVNPFSLLEALPSGDLVVGTVDFRFGMNNAGCIQRISTGATPAVEGCLLENSALAGGFASRMDATDTQLFVLVPRADFSGGDIRVADLSGASATLQTETYNNDDQALADVVVCPTGDVVTAENPPFGGPLNAAQGLRVYTGPKQEVTNLAIMIGLKPTSSHGLVCY